MEKLWVWLIGPIPIKSVSRNAQIQNPKTYVDIYKNATVYKFRLLLFICRKAAYVMEMFWVLLVEPIPIKSVSRKARIQNLKISYVDIYKNALVQKFRTVLFFLAEKLRTFLPNCELFLSNWALETFKSQTWKI